MNKAIAWGKAFWESLPHQAQAAVVVFVAAAVSSLGVSLSETGSVCLQAGCIKHELGAAIGAGIVALRAFYMRPGPGRAGGPSYEGS